MVAVVEHCPARGDVVWLSFEPHAGHEQAGRRPALVLSPKRYNGKVGLALCCPITNRSKGYPFEVILPDGLSVSGVALADQLRTLDWRAREAELACALPSETVAEALAKARTLIE